MNNRTNKGSCTADMVGMALLGGLDANDIDGMRRRGR